MIAGSGKIEYINNQFVLALDPCSNGNGNNKHCFDVVVNATGFNYDLSMQPLYKNLSQARKLSFNSFGGLYINLNTMEVLNHNFRYAQLYTAGPPSFGEKIVVGFLLFIAKDVEKTVNDIIRGF